MNAMLGEEHLVSPGQVNTTSFGSMNGVGMLTAVAQLGLWTRCYLQQMISTQEASHMPISRLWRHSRLVFVPGPGLFSPPHNHRVIDVRLAFLQQQLVGSTAGHKCLMCKTNDQLN
jgi:hypothetical protein